LIGRIERLGLPVTAIVPEGEDTGAFKEMVRLGPGASIGGG
jgi:hypothetical protein